MYAMSKIFRILETKIFQSKSQNIPKQEPLFHILDLFTIFRMYLQSILLLSHLSLIR